MARIGRPQEQLLTLSDIERDELDRLGRSQSHSLVRRAQIILGSAAGEANTSIASRLGVSNPTNLPLAQDLVREGPDRPLRRSQVRAT